LSQRVLPLRLIPLYSLQPVVIREDSRGGSKPSTSIITRRGNTSARTKCAILHQCYSMMRYIETVLLYLIGAICCVLIAFLIAKVISALIVISGW